MSQRAEHDSHPPNEKREPGAEGGPRGHHASGHRSATAFTSVSSQFQLPFVRRPTRGAPRQEGRGRGLMLRHHTFHRQFTCTEYTHWILAMPHRRALFPGKRYSSMGTSTPSHRNGDPHRVGAGKIQSDAVCMSSP